MEQTSNRYLKPGEPEDWRNWPAVTNTEVSVVAPHLWHGVYLYSNSAGCCGLIKKSKVITGPLYTLHNRVISQRHGIAAMTMARGGAASNTWAIVRLQTGRELLRQIACYVKLDHDRLAYRVDLPDEYWPNNMRWGVVELPSGKELMPLTALPFMDIKDPEYIPVADRIRQILDKTATA